MVRPNMYPLLDHFVTPQSRERHEEFCVHIDGIIGLAPDESAGGKRISDHVGTDLLHVVGKDFGTGGMPLHLGNHQRGPAMLIKRGDVHPGFDLHFNDPLITDGTCGMQYSAVGSIATRCVRILVVLV